MRCLVYECVFWYWNVFPYVKVGIIMFVFLYINVSFPVCERLLRYVSVSYIGECMFIWEIFGCCVSPCHMYYIHLEYTLNQKALAIIHTFII